MAIPSSNALRRFAIRFCTIFLFLFVVCALQAQSLNSENKLIRGTVLNRMTREPIPRALVFSPDKRFATLTDGQGRFQFMVPKLESQPPNDQFVRRIALQDFPYTLLAVKPGFLPPDQDQLALRPDADLSNLTIFLTPESLIVGHVAIPTAEAEEKIPVELFRRTIREGAEHWDSAGTTMTRSDGEFRFADLRPGSYKLVTHESLDRDAPAPLVGYPPVYFPSATDFSVASRIQLTAGTTFIADFSLTRRAYYPVKIKIANAGPDVPIGVQVWPQGHPGPGYSLGYNSAEQSIQGMLPDGFYVLQIQSYGPRTLNGSITLVVKGAPADGGVVTLFPSISIPVTFRVEFQHPETLAQFSDQNFSQQGNGGPQTWIRSVQVNLLPAEDYSQTGGASMRQPQSPGDDSPAAIENVQPGRYKVQVTSPFGYVASVTSGGTNLLAKPLVVSPGSVSPPIEVTLRDDGAEISGAIEGAASVAPDGRPPGQIFFLPASDDECQFRTTWLSPEGNFQLQQIPPGTYRVLAIRHLREELEYANPEVMSKYESQTEVVAVAAGQKVQLHLPLASADE